MTEIVALIPVRHGSQRVKNKNFRNFFEDKSLTDIKIQQLKKCNDISKIYLSSDSVEVSQIAQKFNISFLQRDSFYTNDTTPWPEVVVNIVSKIPRDPFIIWALTTAPLFNRFNSAISALNQNAQYDSLVGVLPRKTFFLDSMGQGINFETGLKHPYSQQLKTYYEITGSIFMAKKSVMIENNYWFGHNPLLFELNNQESIDIDTEDDFDFAKKVYGVTNENFNP